MNLSMEMLISIVTSLRVFRRAEDEKRRHARVGLRAEAAILRAGETGQDRTVVSVRDVSRGGIRLLSPVAVQPGERFTLEVEGKSGPERLCCHVMHVRRVSDQFVIGARFVPELAQGNRDQVDARTA